MVGFAMSMPGILDGEAYLHSHMLAVQPEYRNAGIGRKLKLAQREEAIARGIQRMEWTFDPLEIKNAYLNITRLGAVVHSYTPNFYGVFSSRLQAGLPTDRLHAEWWMDSPRVQATLNEAARALPEIEETITFLARYGSGSRLRPCFHGRRLCSPGSEALSRCICARSDRCWIYQEQSPGTG
jgi:predicted GNAT superfamily acetyltransferase